MDALSTDPGWGGGRWRISICAPLRCAPGPWGEWAGPRPPESIAIRERSRQARRGKPRPGPQNFPHTQQTWQGWTLSSPLPAAPRSHRIPSAHGEMLRVREKLGLSWQVSAPRECLVPPVYLRRMRFCWSRGLGTGGHTECPQGPGLWVTWDRQVLCHWCLQM